jgi:hypothetical protein
LNDILRMINRILRQLSIDPGSKMGYRDNDCHGRDP